LEMHVQAEKKREDEVTQQGERFEAMWGGGGVMGQLEQPAGRAAAGLGKVFSGKPLRVKK